MIQVNNISKKFGDAEVLKDISLTLETGKTNLIIGASGSGKTTITKCIVGLIEPDSGQILYDGIDFLSASFYEKKEIRKKIGFLFQGAALFDSLTVFENVMFPLQMLTKLSVQEITKRVEFCLDRVNLSHAASLFPSDLSGGMKKRVGIARAIANNPKYLFCDEPNSGLDPQTSVVIDELIKEITQEFNMTTIVITHDMNSVMSIGDNVFFIYKGLNRWHGSKDEILKTDIQELKDFIFASSFFKKMVAN